MSPVKSTPEKREEEAQGVVSVTMLEAAPEEIVAVAKPLSVAFEIGDELGRLYSIGQVFRYRLVRGQEVETGIGVITSDENGKMRLERT